MCEGGPGGRNIKREGKDKKYGFGGKKREKGQSDPRSLNDLSDYNPKQGGSGRSRSVRILVFFFHGPSYPRCGLSSIFILARRGRRLRSVVVMLSLCRPVIIVLFFAAAVGHPVMCREMWQQQWRWR